MNILTFLILGILTSLLFPPYFFLPLGFIIFPFFCLYIQNNIHKLTIKKLFLFSFSFGFGFFITLLFWIKNPFFMFDETRNYFYTAILLIIVLSLIFSFIFTFCITFNKILPIYILIPIIFIITEFIISIFIYGFPWISFSLIVSSNDFINAFYTQYGSFIVSYIVLQIFCLPALFLEQSISKRVLINFLLIIISPLIISSFINILIKNSNHIEKETVNLEIFQLNLENNFTNDYLQNTINIIKKSINNSKANILIFGENNYPYLIRDLNVDLIRNEIKDDQTVIIGGTRVENNKYFNSLFNITSTNVSYFDKKILVPFGEFLPFRKFLNFIEKISGPNDYTKGAQDRLIKLKNNFSYIPVICYEIIFYWLLVDKNNTKSNMIINITNDIWFGKLLGPYQHFYLTKIRAAEFNKPIIRVSNTGISAIINEEGKILSFIRLNDTKSLKFEIEYMKNSSLNEIHRFLKIYLLIILIILFLLNLKKFYEHKKF